MQRKYKVMIVDDNPMDQLITEYILKADHKKADIILMTSANEALDYLSRYASIPEALPFLIFLDLDMPVMNGYDFLQEFRKYADSVKNGCKIIVITASDIKDDLDRMKDDPHVTKLISKPLRRHSLIL